MRFAYIFYILFYIWKKLNLFKASDTSSKIYFFKVLLKIIKQEQKKIVTENIQVFLFIIIRQWFII